jgi:uncharacterized protein YciU (UPF0263 family)
MDKFLVPSSKTNLLPALISGNKLAIAMHMRMFKDRGVVNYDRTLAIPNHERITAICKSEQGYKEVYTVLTYYLAKTFTNLNLRKGMNEDQILNLVEKIIEESAEDNLSIEDVMLFLEQLEAGKCGKIYDRMDMPTFFEMFEVYREQRHQALISKRQEQEVNYKCLGDASRLSDQHIKEDDSYRRAMQQYNIQQEINRVEKPNTNE